MNVTLTERDRQRITEAVTRLQASLLAVSVWEIGSPGRESLIRAAVRRGDELERVLTEVIERPPVESLTTREAAAECRMSVAAFRKAMSRARERGLDLRLPRDAWPDERTPAYNARWIRDWSATRRANRPRHGVDKEK